jgi:hypothetical protein
MTSCRGEACLARPASTARSIAHGPPRNSYGYGSGDLSFDVAISAADAEQLGVEAGSPALLVDSVTRTEDDVAFEYFSAVYRGDRSTFDIQVVPHEYGPGEQSGFAMRR